MISILKTMITGCLINISLCYYSIAQTNDQQLTHLNEESKTKMGVFYTDQVSIQERKPTTGEIYSEIETIRNLGLKQLSEANTLTKKFNEKLGDNDVKITLYYQPKSLLSIVYKVYDANGKRVSHQIFDFDKDNSCRLFSNYENRQIGELTYSFWKGFLLSTDSKYNSKVLEGGDKQKIIEFAKASLDSMMLHFSEFKYSLNWK
ncbi:MAG: hypothetical protein WCP85_06715 [Mariniphaga sp.]